MLKPLILGLTVLASTSAMSAVPAPSLYGALQWRSIGPFRGGRVLAVSGAQDDPLHFYFGAVNGGVWETRDAGRTWASIFDEAPIGSIGALAVAPSDASVLYVGTGEADMRSDISQGIGLFRSADGGKHWAFSGLGDTQQIAKILVDPRDPNVLLVAALGHPYGPNEQRGVFRSNDGGRSWTKTLFKDVDTGAISLSFQPGNPDVVYAALWQTRRPPWSVYPPSSGPGSGLYKSSDGGRSWRQIQGHGFAAHPGRIGLATSPAAPNRVYALVDAKDEGGLYRSDDDGANWTRTTDDKRIWGRGWYFGEIAVEPDNADVITSLNTVVLKSTNGGHSFVPTKGDPTGDDFHSLWIDPANPNRRILGVDQGALVSLNRGKTWSSWYNQPTAQIYHVSTDNRYPYRVYGAQQDSGAVAISSRTWDTDGIDISQFHEVTAGGESDNIAPDPDDPDTVFGGRVVKLDLKTDQTRNVDPTLALPDHYRSEWTLPLVWGKREHALYFGNQRIFRTADNGEHWTAISPDLTRPRSGIPANLDPPTAADDEENEGPRKGVVYSIAPSARAAGDLWAGTDDGLVWRTRDAGAHWSDITPAGLQPWSKIGSVEPSHFDDVTAYLAIDRHRLDDQAPYALRTHDGGRSWQSIAAGLSDGAVPNSVNVIREDPTRARLLYAGTEHGLFVSFDDGGHWSALQKGLPRTSVRDIEVHGEDLVIATHGRGFYILDDIASLREVARDARGGMRLFTPAAAILTRPRPFNGTPKPKDEPMAPNPPSGAILDYYLPASSRAPVRIVIRDAAGKLVRQYSSSDKRDVPSPAEMKVAPEWLDVPLPPSAAAGQHRFVWDLRYAPSGGDGSGVWAPPGHYNVQLIAGRQSFTQAVEVKPDPRVTLAPEAYRRQFDLARRIEADQVRADAVLAEAAKADKALATMPASSTLQARLSNLTGIKSEGRRSAPPPASSLTVLSAALAALRSSVDDADADPSRDAAAGYALAAQSLERALSGWAALRPELVSAGALPRVAKKG